MYEPPALLQTRWRGTQARNNENDGDEAGWGEVWDFLFDIHANRRRAVSRPKPIGD